MLGRSSLYSCPLVWLTNTRRPRAEAFLNLIFYALRSMLFGCQTCLKLQLWTSLGVWLASVYTVTEFVIFLALGRILET
jgi:hypothetical protein